MPSSVEFLRYSKQQLRVLLCATHQIYRRVLHSPATVTLYEARPKFIAVSIEITCIRDSAERKTRFDMTWCRIENV